MAFFMNSFKYLIFLVNLIFFGLGSYLLYNTYQQLGNDVFNLDSALKSPIYFTLVIAAVIVFISFLGCCGTCNENSCMIKAYATLIFVCVILQIAVVVWLYRMDPDQISQGIKKNVIMNFRNQSTSTQKSIQLIQSSNNCCGVDGWQDYSEIKHVPDSCCNKYNEETNSTDFIGHCNQNDLEKVVGCKVRLQSLISDNYKNVYIIIGCVFGFQLLVIILSCALSNNIKEQYNVV